MRGSLGLALILSVPASSGGAVNGPHDPRVPRALSPYQGHPAKMHLALAVPKNPHEQGALSQGWLTLRLRVLCALPPLPYPPKKERATGEPSPSDRCPSVCPAEQEKLNASQNAPRK